MRTKLKIANLKRVPHRFNKCVFYKHEKLTGLYTVYTLHTF